MSLWQKRNDGHQIVEGKRVLGIGSVVWGRGREGVFRQRGSETVVEGSRGQKKA